jgi:hypothetical protein
MALDSTGASFRRAALELREADRTMYLVVRKEIRETAEPAVEAVRKSALATLPKGGRPVPLNQWVADATIKTSILTGPRSAGVVIRARKTGHDLPKINAGVARHPVHGNRKAWSNTYVTPGFFTKPLDAMEPAVSLRMLHAMTETARIAGFH